MRIFVIVDNAGVSARSKYILCRCFMSIVENEKKKKKLYRIVGIAVTIQTPSPLSSRRKKITNGQERPDGTGRPRRRRRIQRPRRCPRLAGDLAARHRNVRSAAGSKKLGVKKKKPLSKGQTGSP